MSALPSDPGEVPRSAIDLGRAARARGEHEAALAYFAQAAASSAGNPWPRLEQAATLRTLRRVMEADALYRAVLADHPGNAHALLGLGYNARGRGQLEVALGHFTDAAAAGAATPWPRLEQAATLRTLRRCEDADALYHAILADYPGNAHALLGLGLLARDRGHRDESRAKLLAATDADPGLSRAWLELAADLREAADFDGARSIAQRLLAVNSADLQAWMSLGCTERAADRHDDALAAFRGAHRSLPVDPYPLIEMASEMRALSQPDEADRILLRALERDPTNLQALEQLGEAARLAKNYDESIARFEAAIDAQPKSPWAWLGAARTLCDLGRADEAETRLAEAIRHCGWLPEFEAAQLDLAWRAGQWREALSQARRGTAAAPDHPGLWFQRFRLEKLLAEPDEVDACLRAAPATTVQSQARLQHCRGLAEEEQWRLDDAILHYEHALDLCPDDAWILSDLTRARILALQTVAARADLDRLAERTRPLAVQQGRSPNASQTHFGQLLDEFTIDQEALSQLEALRPLTAEARIDTLCRLVRERPDYTPAAMVLLIALRQSGGLTSPPPSTEAGGAAIPSHIVQYWDSDEVPAEITELMAGWRKAHPSYKFTLFDDRRAQDYLRETCPAPALAAYRRAREPAQKADILRLARLFAEGGWYLDADDRCLAPLSTVAPGSAGLVLYQEDYGTVGNNVIGARPQHPAIGLALELAVGAVNRGDNDILWLSTGPGLLTRALAQTLVSPRLTLSAWLRSIRVLPRREMHRVVGMHCQVGYKTTERHWSRTAFAHRKQAASRQLEPVEL